MKSAYSDPAPGARTSRSRLSANQASPSLPGHDPGRGAAARNGLWALGALLMACVLLLVVTGLMACSGLGELPTLVPSLVLPTAAPGATATSPPPPAPASLHPALVISHTFDPVEHLSGVRVEASEPLWVVRDDAFAEYRHGESGELLPFKVITYTYDDMGRRVGWSVSWPQGPTATQRLAFLYEGLVAVGERLEVGGVVTTTYYDWASRDRNTTVDGLAPGVAAPITDVTRYDARCQAAAETDCVALLARVIVSEASVGNAEEQRAVAWTFRNRLDRGLSLLSYAMDRTPDRAWYAELAREVLTASPEADVTKGATHFFSPRSMPLQGQEGRCKANGGIYDCAGGLVLLEELDAPAYAPYWHLLYEWLPVAGIRKTHFLFYRIPPIRPRVGQ